MMYYYWAYGLTIKSEMEFPELLPLPENTIHDIELVCDIAPEHNQENLHDVKKTIYISSDAYKLILPDVATYWAENGNSIIIQPALLADMSKVRLFCLSNVFAAILNQRGIIPIHAAALKVNDKLVLICGHSGAGKSTLVGALMSRGFSIFSDDVCVPATNLNNQILMYSSYPMMKFWEDTIKQLPNLGEPDVQLRPNVNKFGFYFHEQFDNSPKWPVMVFFLEISEELHHVVLQEVKGFQLFQYLESNAYRGEYLGAVDLRKEHFDLFSNLANQLRGFMIKRPIGENSIDYITDLVFEKINQQFLNE
jgi:hypothetical protein